MTTIHHSPPPGTAPFAIYEDPEDHEPPSPSELYEGDVPFNSEISLPEADEAIPSIENQREAQDEPEPYCGSYTSRPSILSSSRRASGMTTTSFISSLPSEISVASKPVPPANTVEPRYTPRRDRPPFRNPSSVRAMQMASPPPLPAIEASRERLKGNYKLATPSRSGRSESVSTTSSRRSRHRDSMHRELQAHQSQRPTPTPQQPLPLVLLHVTILPMQLPFAHDIMVKVMPDWLVENYRHLEEKLRDVVLMRRGLLIPHPRDEYDMLEERILESLELQTPRLLKCGHFIGTEPDDVDGREDEEDGGSMTDDGTGRGSRMSGGTVTAEEDGEWKYPTPDADDESICTDCHRQVKRPGKGIGQGTKKWDLKIFAANGLMRAGAWAAAWSEMERCDVDISPWIPDEVRKALDNRLEEEQEATRIKQLYAAELQRQIEEKAVKQAKLAEEADAKQRAEEAELQRRIEAEAAALQKKLEEEAAEKRKLEETLNEKIEEAKEAIRLEFEAQALSEANSVAERFRTMEEALKKEQEKVASQMRPAQHHIPVHHVRNISRSRPRSSSRRPDVNEIPIGTLLWNYFALLLRDSRNFFIMILIALVVFLATNSNPTWNLQAQSSDLTSDLPLDHIGDPVSVVITSTATMTSVSTLTVTEPRLQESIHKASPFTLAGTPSSISEAETASQSTEVVSQVSASGATQGTLGASISTEVISEPATSTSSAATSVLVSPMMLEEFGPSESGLLSLADDLADDPATDEVEDASPSASTTPSTLEKEAIPEPENDGATEIDQASLDVPEKGVPEKDEL